jgi:hypothetical protein
MEVLLVGRVKDGLVDVLGFEPRVARSRRLKAFARWSKSRWLNAFVSGGGYGLFRVF